MAVPLWIDVGRTWHPVLVVLAGDTGDAAPGKTLLEHPPDLRRRHRIGVQSTQPPNPRSVCPVRVRSGVDQPMPIRRPTTQVTALVDHLCLHRGQHPVTGTQNLALRLRPRTVIST